MQKTKLLYFKRTRGLARLGSNYIGQLFGRPFEGDAGFGFHDTVSQEGVISSKLVYASSLVQRAYDRKTNAVLMRRITTINEAPFELDCKTGLLQVHVGGRGLQKVVAVLGDLFRSRVGIEDVYLNLAEFIKRLERRGGTYRVAAMVVENFRPSAGLIGRFSASVTDQRIVRGIMRAYGLDVTEVTVETLTDDHAALCHLSSIGRIAIRADEEVVSSQADLITELALGDDDA